MKPWLGATGSKSGGGRNTPMDFPRVEDRGIRGGDFLDKEESRFMAGRVASDNPIRVTYFYGFRVFRNSRQQIT